MKGKPTFFGIRHLSPAAAYHVRRALDEAKPQLVLVEGPSDLNDQIAWLWHPETVYPVAILTFTKQPPVRTILYPFAYYSPEIQAILWAHEHHVTCRFMDLPSQTFLAFQRPGEAPEGESKEDAKEDKAKLEGPDTTDSVYRRLETLTEEDHDTFWERNFEHFVDTKGFQEAANTFGYQLREATEDAPWYAAENLVREAYMKRVIQDAEASGIPAEKIFCVCGAFHVAGLETNEPMTDKEKKSLPVLESTATLMPYSYYRLSTRSGYGAGNKAPAYFELLWESLNRGGPGETAYRYLTILAKAQRKAGNPVSSAEVIEAVRLAQTVSAMRGSRFPCLQDLREAAIATMGHGNFSEISIGAAEAEIGTKIGFLPEGVSRTSVQEDFYQKLKQLRLEKYRTANAAELDLDLREKLNVRSEQAARMDLFRSFFLHRLRVLGISFVKQLPSHQEGANWGEYWLLQWTPEAEIQIAESALMGDTIQGATAYQLKNRADQAATIAEAAAIFQDAFLCGLPEAAQHALYALQRLSIDAAALADVAATAEHLSMVVRYGDLRNFNFGPVIPLLEQLFLRACLTLEDACICDAKAAPGVMEAMGRLNSVQLSHDFLDESRWLALLTQVSDRDDLNTSCSGYAMAILLERGSVDEELLAREVSRRLSPGIPADLGAGWFEGLAAKNRYALIARLSLWRHLDDYLKNLDDLAFRRALVFLRRAFSSFSPAEKNDVAENLSEIWGLHQKEAEALMKEMTVEEQELLGSLEEFDFDDI